jgi:hypothetical protein
MKTRQSNIDRLSAMLHAFDGGAELRAMMETEEFPFPRKVELALQIPGLNDEVLAVATEILCHLAKFRSVSISRFHTLGHLMRHHHPETSRKNSRKRA